MKRINGILSIAAFALLVLAVPSIASAQYGNGGYYPNGNGGYGNNGYYGDIRSTVRSLKDQAQDFEHLVDRDKNFGSNGGYNNGGYGNGGYYNRDAYKDLKKVLDRFTEATDKLEDKYDSGRDMNRSYDAARNVVNTAYQVDQLLNNFGNGYWRNDWSRIQDQVRVVANTFGMDYNGSRRGNRNGSWGNGNRNGNGNRGGWGNQRNVPSWWPF